jgi:chemotaxis regulatin CheY-phosphate phosphatase CheZ
MGRPNELLFDSEASLRLVDRALTDLHDSDASATASISSTEISRARQTEPSLLDLPNTLLRAYTEINTVLQKLRQSRDLLQRTTMESLHRTSDKLREVTFTTEIAATDMLDGLDRALVIVDELDDGEDAETAGPRKELRMQLRSELFGLMTCLQFQDITAQQLSYASGVLAEMEERLCEVASIFDFDRLGPRAANVDQPESSGPAFDPAGTTVDAVERQALVDAIFTMR